MQTETVDKAPLSDGKAKNKPPKMTQQKLGFSRGQPKLKKNEMNGSVSEPKKNKGGAKRKRDQNDDDSSK